MARDGRRDCGGSGFLRSICARRRRSILSVCSAIPAAPAETRDLSCFAIEAAPHILAPATRPRSRLTGQQQSNLSMPARRPDFFLVFLGPQSVLIGHFLVVAGRRASRHAAMPRHTSRRERDSSGSEGRFPIFESASRTLEPLSRSTNRAPSPPFRRRWMLTGIEQTWPRRAKSSAP